MSNSNERGCPPRMFRSMGGAQYRVRKPPFGEPDLLAREPDPAKVVRHLLQAHGQLRESTKLLPAIAGIHRFVRRRQPMKGIKSPNIAILAFVSRQHGGHHDTSSAAPDTGFDEITRNLATQDRLAPSRKNRRRTRPITVRAWCGQSRPKTHLPASRQAETKGPLRHSRRWRGGHRTDDQQEVRSSRSR